MASSSPSKKGQGGQGQVAKKSSTKDCLYDGFREIFSFPVHKLDIKGFSFIGEDVRHSDGIKKEAYVSWDIKQVVLWEKLSIEDDPRAIVTMKYEVANLISAAVYISKLKIFLCAALDMTFRIYDKRFNFLETINHEERAILHMEYDPKEGQGKDKDILIIGGASGVSVWRIIRSNNLDTNHTLEKMYFFEGFSGWVNKMIYEPYSNRVYAIVNETIHILSFKRRAVVAKLEKIHDSPITAVVWYARSQFYVTGCSLGLLKCWSPHFSRANKNSSSGGGGDNSKEKGSNDLEKYEDEDGIPRHQTPGINNFALLHTFNAHSKGVTSLVLHPISGLVISTSMDGFLKVFNLENLTELFAIDNGHPIDAMRLIPYGTALDFTGKTIVGRGCLFSQPDGTMKLWHITSLCGFFGVCNSKIKKNIVFENLHRGVEMEMRGMNIVPPTNKDPKLIPRVVVGHGSHDLRAFFHKGFLPTSFMDPDSVVNGIIDFTISVYLQLMYVLLEIGVVRVYSLRYIVPPAIMEFVKDVRLKNELDVRDATCMTLVDFLPSAELRPSGEGLGSKDLRGEPVPAYIVEQLVIGTKSGTIFFLDTLNGSQITWVGQLHFGPILEVKYRRPRNELVIFCKDSKRSAEMFTVKVFNATTMTLTHELPNIYNVTGFNIAPSSDMFGLGCDDGYCRLYQLSGSDSSCLEVLSQSVTHDASVISLAFNDNLRVYASCSSDSTVMIWDYNKQLIRQLKYHIPTNDIAVMPTDSFPEGTFLLTQGYYILTITKKTWDEGDKLEHMKGSSAEWTSDWTQEMIDNLDGIAGAKKKAISNGTGNIAGIGGDSRLNPNPNPNQMLQIQTAPNDRYIGGVNVGGITFGNDNSLFEGLSQTVQVKNGKVSIDLFRDCIDYWGVNALESKFEQQDDYDLRGSMGFRTLNNKFGRSGGALRPKVSAKSTPHAIPQIDFEGFAGKIVNSVVKGKDKSKGGKKSIISNSEPDSKLKTLDLNFLLDEEEGNDPDDDPLRLLAAIAASEMKTTDVNPATTSYLSPRSGPPGLSSSSFVDTSAATPAVELRFSSSRGEGGGSIISTPRQNPLLIAPGGPKSSSSSSSSSSKMLGSTAPSERYRTFLSPRARLTLLNSTELGSGTKSDELKADEREQMKQLISSLKNADYFDPKYENKAFDNMITLKEKQLSQVAKQSLPAEAVTAINRNIKQLVAFDDVFNEFATSKRAYKESKSTKDRLLNEYSTITKAPDRDEISNDAENNNHQQQRGQVARKVSIGPDPDFAKGRSATMILIKTMKSTKEHESSTTDGEQNGNDSDDNNEHEEEHSHHHHHVVNKGAAKDKKGGLDRKITPGNTPASTPRSSMIGGGPLATLNRRQTQMKQDLENEEEALKKIEQIINKKSQLLEEGLSDEGQKTIQAFHNNTNVRKRNND